MVSLTAETSCNSFPQVESLAGWGLNPKSLLLFHLASVFLSTFISMSTGLNITLTGAPFLLKPYVFFYFFLPSLFLFVVDLLKSDYW